MNRRGWIVWSMSKLGVVFALAVMFLILFMAYRYITCVNASDSGNKLTEDLSDTIARIYSGPPGIETLYRLPAKIKQNPYSLAVVDSTKRGLLANVSGTRCGTGMAAAPLNAVLSSYPRPLKNESEGNKTLFIKNLESGVYIGFLDACIDCIVLEELNYDAPGDDCVNPNGEYAIFRNTCDESCNLTGWAVGDAIEPRPEYVFKKFTLKPGATVTLYTGCGTDSSTRLYWCGTYSGCKAIWNNDGDTLQMREHNGYIFLEYTYPAGG